MKVTTTKAKDKTHKSNFKFSHALDGQFTVLCTGSANSKATD